MTNSNNTTSTLISVILDRSGSMSVARDYALETINSFLEEQIREGPTRITLTLFNEKTETPYVAIPGQEFRPLTRHDYRPDGLTGLLDAVGRTLDKTERWIRQQPKEHRPSQTVFVIVTDGLENASTRWTNRHVRNAIKRLEDQGAQFVFLGANQDSWLVGHDLGIHAGVTIDFAVKEQSMKAALAEASSAAIDYRRSRTQQRRHRDHR